MRIWKGKKVKKKKNKTKQKKSLETTALPFQLSLSLPLPYLGRHIVQRPGPREGELPRRVDREAEVPELDAAVVGHEEVLRFNVSVDDPAGVHGRERPEQRSDDGSSGVPRPEPPAARQDQGAEEVAAAARLDDERRFLQQGVVEGPVEADDARERG